MKDYKTLNLAVVGASADPLKYGHSIFRDLLASRYTAIGVNPKGEDILGHKVYPALKDLPLVPDVVITVVPPRITDTIIDQCVELGVKEIWMQPGSESEQAAEKARHHGITVTMSCFMKAQHIW